MLQAATVIESSSIYDFDKTVEMIIEEAERRDWKVPAVHDLQLSLEKAGKKVKPVKIIEICKPAYSGRMLELNNERIMSVMMPCRISVYLKDDDKTYLSLLNGAAMAGGQEGIIADVMKAASDETFEIVKVVTGG
jgi:uncharacterized protein (DUF302 family)